MHAIFFVIVQKFSFYLYVIFVCVRVSVCLCVCVFFYDEFQKKNYGQVSLCGYSNDVFQVSWQFGLWMFVFEVLLIRLWIRHLRLKLNIKWLVLDWRLTNVSVTLDWVYTHFAHGAADNQCFLCGFLLFACTVSSLFLHFAGLFLGLCLWLDFLMTTCHVLFWNSKIFCWMSTNSQSQLCHNNKKMLLLNEK